LLDRGMQKVEPLAGVEGLLDARLFFRNIGNGLVRHAIGPVPSASADMSR
jgi:hypothetical protein